MNCSEKSFQEYLVKVGCHKIKQCLSNQAKGYIPKWNS